MDSNPPCVSFIGIVDFSQNAHWLFVTDSVADLLGFEPNELIGRPSLELVHPDEFPRVKQLHYDTIRQDKAAVLVYLRLKHKDPYKGYILCAVSRTVVDNVLVGGVSFASPGPKAMHNASTAQEVLIISPSAKRFEFRRWNDPSPMPPSLIPSGIAPSGSLPSPISSPPSPPSPAPPAIGHGSRIDHLKSSNEGKPSTEFTFDPLPPQSPRTALILDRFSINSTVIYCTNNNMFSTTEVLNRSFFEFVSMKDEDLVRSWIDAIKGWGVNERGQPSDGGFGFGKFDICPEGRGSITVESTSSRGRHGSSSRPQTSRTNTRPGPSRQRSKDLHTSTSVSQFSVDAIFSAHSDGLMVILRRAS